MKNLIRLIAVTLGLIGCDVNAQTNRLATERYATWRAAQAYTQAVEQVIAATNGITAASLGALTNETDEAALAALAEYAEYWPKNATASSWFTFTTNSGAITITGYDIGGGADVIVPDYINGYPVTAIGDNAFSPDYQGMAITSVGGAGKVQTIGESAFEACNSLTTVSLPQAQIIGNYAFGSCSSFATVSLPQAQTIGSYAFRFCTSLATVSLPQAQTIGTYVFYACTSLATVSLPQAQTIGGSAFRSCTSLTSVYLGQNAPTEATEVFYDTAPTIYVTNPQATGWGETWNGRPVVRLALYADEYWQGGERLPTFAQMAATNAAAYRAWTGTVTPTLGTATVAVAHGNMPVLVLGGAAVLTLDPTGYGTAGVSRVSLSLWRGTNTLELATNVVEYATAPTLPTNEWSTILFRRVSDGAWKGAEL